MFFNCQTRDLIQKAKELFDTLYSRRQLIRLIGIRFSDLIPGTYQINLFNDTQEQIRLYHAIDSIKKQYGEKYVIRAISSDPNKNYRPVPRKLFKNLKI